MTMATNGCKPHRLVAALWLLLLACALPAPAWTGDVARLGMNVRVARDLNRGDVQTAMTLWAEELSRKYEVPAEIFFYDDMASLRRDFDQGKVNFVIAAGMDFARHFKADELAEGFRGGLVADHTLLLLVHQAGGVKSLADLEGKRIALLKDDELSEVYLETLCLRKFQRPCQQVFSAIEPVANSNQLLMRLFFHKADVVLSRRNGYEVARELNPQIGQIGEVLTQFPIKSSYYGLYNRKVNPGFRQFSLRRMPDMHRTPRGRQVLDVFKVDRLELVSESELRPFYDLLAQYEALLARTLKARAGK